MAEALKAGRAPPHCQHAMRKERMEGKHPAPSAPLLPSPLLLQTQLITQAPSSNRFLILGPQTPSQEIAYLESRLSWERRKRKKVRCRNKFIPYN